MKTIRDVKWEDIETGMEIRVNYDVMWKFVNKNNDIWTIEVFSREGSGRNIQWGNPFGSEVTQEEYEDIQNEWRTIRECDMIDENYA